MTTRWRNYSGNLRKIFNIIGPNSWEKICKNCTVVSTLLHNAVYSNFFLSHWTNDVEDFPKLSSQIFDCCPRNFLIQEKQNGNAVSSSHRIRPVFECINSHHPPCFTITLMLRAQCKFTIHGQ